MIDISELAKTTGENVAVFMVLQGQEDYTGSNVNSCEARIEGKIEEITIKEHSIQFTLNFHSIAWFNFSLAKLDTKEERYKMSVMGDTADVYVPILHLVMRRANDERLLIDARDRNYKDR